MERVGAGHPGGQSPKSGPSVDARARAPVEVVTSQGGHPLTAHVAGVAATPIGGGYWEVAADGNVFAFGSAQDLGGEGGRVLAGPVVGLVPSP